jgi:hypothetical protein
METNADPILRLTAIMTCTPGGCVLRLSIFDGGGQASRPLVPRPS